MINRGYARMIADNIPQTLNAGRRPLNAQHSVRAKRFQMDFNVKIIRVEE